MGGATQYSSYLERLRKATRASNVSRAYHIYPLPFGTRYKFYKDEGGNLSNLAIGAYLGLQVVVYALEVTFRRGVHVLGAVNGLRLQR